MMSTFKPADWRDIRLVAFDVDGTLYRQRPLRLRMGRDMVLHTVAKCDRNAISVVSAYRRIRERLAAEEVVDFDRVLIAETAKATSKSPEGVHAIVSEWIETRPLRYLRICLFAQARRSAFSQITPRRRSSLRPFTIHCSIRSCNSIP